MGEVLRLNQAADEGEISKMKPLYIPVIPTLARPASLAQGRLSNGDLTKKPAVTFVPHAITQQESKRLGSERDPYQQYFESKKGLSPVRLFEIFALPII